MTEAIHESILWLYTHRNIRIFKKYPELLNLLNASLNLHYHLLLKAIMRTVIVINAQNFVH